MFQRILASLAALLLLLTLTACPLRQAAEEPASSSSEESASDENFPVTVGGAELSAAPETVVSLSPALTELVCDLGYSKRLTGVSDYCAYEGGALDGLTRVGTVLNLDIGAVTRLAPGLVLTSTPLSEADSTALSEAGIPVTLLERAPTVDALETLYTDAATALAGDPAGADEGRAFFTERMEELDEIRALVEAGEGETPTVCYLRAMPLVLAGGDTFEGDLLSRAGFVNSAAEQIGWDYPEDKKADLLPDVIFYDKAVSTDALSATDIYNTTPAWNNKKCFALDMDAFEQQGVLMFALLKELAEQAMA